MRAIEHAAFVSIARATGFAALAMMGIEGLNVQEFRLESPTTPL